MNDIQEDIALNQREAYGDSPDGRMSRILPFVDTKGEPMFTLVQEWFEGGKVIRDSRQWMSQTEFLNLCGSAATAFDRLERDYGYVGKA